MIKNNIIYVVTILIGLFNTVNGQNLEKSKLVHSEDLNLVYKYAVESPDSTELGKLFFYIFPSEFEAFNQNYGFIEGKGKMPLYDEYVQHINLLFKQYSQIPDSVFYAKIVNIAIGGRWDVDATNFFQDHLSEVIHLNPQMIVSVLHNYEKKEIRNFCKFIIDGINPNDPGLDSKFHSLHNEFLKVDNQIAKILEMVHREQIKNSETSN